MPPKDTTTTKRKSSTLGVEVDPTQDDKPIKDPPQKKQRKQTVNRILDDDSFDESNGLDDSIPSSSLPSKDNPPIPHEDIEDPFPLPHKEIFYPPSPISPLFSAAIA
ncbi:hypothetical protein E6C27_scaffold128G00760 [Cucumis melo var. makuwa]|uniref:Uncharacterized protein n=1 Tax=Cucumis melo var. makuwa TaxID=1194695 RepID=A0A5A7TIC0_CUCMM|nr:hypothetical protein E6C27_scaffold128G00760 [Cucumis melo var. makuwa]